MNFFWTTAVEASLLPLGDNRKDDTVSFICKIVIGEGSKRDRAIPSVWGWGWGGGCVGVCGRRVYVCVCVYIGVGVYVGVCGSACESVYVWLCMCVGVGVHVGVCM